MITLSSLFASLELTVSDVESNLSTLHTLLTSQERIRSQSSSRETPAARQAADEISRVLDLLEGDLEDLDESVRAVEAVGDRWGIGEGEKKGRRAFVERVKREVQVSSSTHNSCATYR